jgi:hypothetical protein
MDQQAVANLVNANLRSRANAGYAPRFTAAQNREFNRHQHQVVNGRYDAPGAWSRHLADEALAGNMVMSSVLEAMLLDDGINIVDEALAIAFPFVAPVVRQMKVAVVAPQQVTNEYTASLVVDGVYTVGLPDGGHRTFKVRTQASAERQLADKPLRSPFAPGEMVVGMLTGSCNTSDYTNIGFVKANGRLATWSRQRGTQFEARTQELVDLLTGTEKGINLKSQGYTVEVSKTCRRCGRVLTAPESLLSGYGSECINMGM